MSEIIVNPPAPHCPGTQVQLTIPVDFPNQTITWKKNNVVFVPVPPNPINVIVPSVGTTDTYIADVESDNVLYRYIVNITGVLCCNFSLPLPPP